MKRPWFWLMFSACLAGLVALAVLYPKEMISPGPLRSAHSDLSDNCAACHAPFRGAVAERCIHCHSVAAIGLRTTTGKLPLQPAVQAVTKATFHQALTTQDCLACHSEHPTPRLTPVRQTTFSHTLLEAGTRGNCAACHTAPNDRMHETAPANCAQCHTPERWKPATFAHDRFFVLDGDHRVACATCHVGNDYRSYTCYGCHEHQPDRIGAKHIQEGIPNFQNCVQCHRDPHAEPGEGNSGRRGAKNRDE
jgi:hypothetical protein